MNPPRKQFSRLKTGTSVDLKCPFDYPTYTWTPFASELPDMRQLLIGKQHRPGGSLLSQAEY
jgi:hypothetical protein